MELIDKNDLLKRMSIGAPMNWTDSERELGEESQFKSDMLTIQCCQEVPAIPIPPKATNGDMFVAVWGYAPSQLRAQVDWWNAPYKYRKVRNKE